MTGQEFRALKNGKCSW